MTKRIFSHISAFFALLCAVPHAVTCAAVCTALLSVLSVLPVSAADTDNIPQGEVCKVPVEFRINSWVIEPSFSDNAAHLRRLRVLIDEVNANPALVLDSLTVSGFASPDGSLPKNRELSLRRAFALCDFLNKEFDIPDSMIVLGINEVPWPLFRSIISAGDYPWRDDAMRILSYGSDSDAVDNARRMSRLKKLHRGKAWETVREDILPQLRSAFVVTTVVTQREGRESKEDKESKELREPTEEGGTTYATVMADIAELSDGDETADAAELIEALADDDDMTDADAQAVVGIADSIAGVDCGKGWQLGTNAIEWGLLIANINGEWDFDCHWSLHASLHYSALNYFTATRKFRTFIFRPEVRYWLGDGHRGVFVDGYLQMAAYNFALSSWKYRIQDVNGHHPALGGGVGVGYRMPLGKSGRWSLEAALGVGAYHLKYDRFENRPNGQKVDTRSRNWLGIDNVAISLVFNLGKSESR